MTETQFIGGTEQRRVVLVDHDPDWANRYVRHAGRLRAALGRTLITVDHIGSTSVPGLAAKPIIDVLITVPDITAEEDYLDPMITAGYVLRVREPDHQMMRTHQRDVHVHVLESDNPAAEEYLLFRDHLRTVSADRRLYEATKRDLATRTWANINDYADAKTAVIDAIKERARTRKA